MFALYINTTFTSESFIETFFVKENYESMIDILLFFIGILCFAFFSLLGVKNKCFNVVALILFIMSFLSLPFSDLLIHGRQNYGYCLYMFKDNILFLMPLLLIISISISIILSRYSKEEKTKPFANPEMKKLMKT
ncbi:MAG: hypothetical protein K8S87_07340 [Planctomycetes bacterium]|nr:hypothetical protein [Planctomycetota bacterium]